MTEPRTYSLAELGALEVLDVDALRSMFKLEMQGEALYDALADRVGNDDVAVLLRRNGKEEAGHARRIQRMLTIKLGTEFEPTPDLLEAPTIRLPDVVGPELLASIVQVEFDGDAGYQKWADNEPDPEVARLLRLNGREETIHGERIQQALAILG